MVGESPEDDPDGAMRGTKGSHVKPALSEAAVTAFLADLLDEVPTPIERVVEGLESQVFRFEVSDRAFVVRINPSLRGFEKDLWADSMLSERVPVPRVASLGAFDSDHAYCISEWVSGTTLEDLPVADAEGVVEEVANVWRLIAATDVSSIDGVGDFDPDGQAPASSWREVLIQTLEAARRELNGATDVIDAYERLIDHCPEERALIHADFGSNNVLAERGRITAVLDWDQAMVGDPLHDVANFYFWATHLRCMEVQATYFERTLSQLPAYRERISCYALRIGLEEARENVRDGDLAMAEWALARSREVIAG
jgi:hygromycin-B 4-O-kinase